jgi:hypothetical protein
LSCFVINGTLDIHQSILDSLDTRFFFRVITVQYSSDSTRKLKLTVTLNFEGTMKRKSKKDGFIRAAPV